MDSSLLYLSYRSIFQNGYNGRVSTYVQRGRRGMAKKCAIVLFAIAVLIIMVSFSATGSADQSLACSACRSGVVDKMPCEAFVVKIVFKNTGKAEGTWSVNIAFEGDAWSWSGTPQSLTLKPESAKTLVWNGNVPRNATADSVARLIVYYGDFFKPLGWWMRIIPGAELTVASSSLE